MDSIEHDDLDDLLGNDEPPDSLVVPEEVRELAELEPGPFTMDRVAGLAAIELDGMERINSLLYRLEQFLFSDANLAALAPENVLALYEQSVRRKEISSRFLIRYVELGVKVKLFEKVMEGEEESVVLAKKNPHTEKAKAQLRKMINESSE